MKKLDKRGSGHFEVIISFVFFVGFVFFLFSVLTPEDTKTLPVSVIRGLHASFKETASINLSKVFSSVNGNTGSCFYIDLPENLFDFPLNNVGAIVTNLSGNTISSKLSNGNLNIASLEKHFKILISPEFTNGAIGPCHLIEDFEIGSIVENEIISYHILEGMENQYDSNYENLKQNLKVPALFDFAIIAEGLGINMEPINGVPSATDIISKEYVYEVLHENGEISNERFILKVW